MSEARHPPSGFVDARDQHAEIVRDDLAQDLVDLADLGLRPERVTELRLDHAERRLDIRPLVVAGREHLASEGEQVVHAAPGGRVL